VNRHPARRIFFEFVSWKLDTDSRLLWSRALMTLLHRDDLQEHVMTGPCLQQYKIRALIGEGTLGTVYAAEHPTLRRKAAIKILRPGRRRDLRQLALFSAEGRAVRAFRHPHVAALLEVGQLPEGQPYLIGELLGGETLGDRLRRVCRLPIRDVVEFALQAAKGLGAAHERGIVHGGLSREDVFIIPDLRMRFGERIKLTDFGTGRLRRAVVTSATAGDVPGTAVYLAPEQLQPRRRVDYRADIYALGGLIYHALCGVPPFVADTRAALRELHLHALPARPRSLNPDINYRLERAILRALAKRPDDRFASMAAFARDLESAMLPPRRHSRVPAVSLSAAATMCLVLLLSARAPGGVSSAPQSPAAAPARGPHIVVLPPAAAKRAKGKRRVKRPATALLDRSVIEREDIWGQRH
jgi:serine/threonine protein kinase